MAAGAPMAPPSPRPLAPVTEDAAGVSMWCNSIGGISRAVGGSVVGERRGLDIAERVVDDFLEQRIADALRDAAMHLAVGNQRIDDAAGIFDGEEFFDRDAAGFHVDFDDRDVAGIGERAGRIVMRAFAASPARCRR